MRCGRLDSQYLSRSRARNLWDFIHATPFRCYNEQRFLVSAAEHAGKAATISIDCLQHLATFADAPAALVRNVRVPDRSVGIEADTVGSAFVEVGPDASVRQGAVRSDVECGKPFAGGLGNNQRSIIGSHRHAIREGEAIGYVLDRTSGWDT